MGKIDLFKNYLIVFNNPIPDGEDLTQGEYLSDFYLPYQSNETSHNPELGEGNYSFMPFSCVLERKCYTYGLVKNLIWLIGSFSYDDNIYVKIFLGELFVQDRST